MNRSTRLRLACLALSLAFAISSCGDGLDLPANLAGSSGSGGSASTPTPAATPAPATPTPTATPSTAGSCTLPTRPDCGNSGCCNDTGTRNQFEGLINTAQADLERNRPEIFNPNGSLRLDEIEYTNLLASRLMALNPGLCARGGGANGESISKDEVAIKSSNDLSQNVDVIIGSSHTPYIGSVHTCRPASF